MNKQDFLNHPSKTFYGEFYGRQKTNVNAEYLKINKTACHIEKDGILYIWGWPGDSNFYKWIDYGNTWAFNKEELGDVKFYARDK